MYISPKYCMGHIYAKQTFCRLMAHQMLTGHPALLLPTSGNIRGRNKVRKSFSQILPHTLGRDTVDRGRRQPGGLSSVWSCLRGQPRGPVLWVKSRLCCFFDAESGQWLHLLSLRLSPGNGIADVRVLTLHGAWGGSVGSST